MAGCPGILHKNVRRQGFIEHRFVGQHQQSGSRAALVDRDVDIDIPPPELTGGHVSIWREFRFRHIVPQSSALHVRHFARAGLHDILIACRNLEIPLSIRVMNNSQKQHRSIAGSAARGFRNRCPNCGQGALFLGYLRPFDACTSCREPNGRIMAHDAPPYITILIVGHIIVPLVLIWEKTSSPPLWAHYGVWMTATVILTLALLPRIKGAWMGFMWALRLHGNEFQ